uniref:Uncharacterized protein n=1 Tax=Oryza glaberrima TaxID=4538 RepID=I1NX81_ORYGL
MARVVVFVVGGSCAASSVRILHYGAPSPSSERCSRCVRRDRSHRSFKPPFEDTAAYLHALDPTVQYRDKHSLETCYEPLFFFRKHPAVEFHHPIDAPDSMFDRVILTEWAKPAMRGVLETISSHHSANLELTEFSLKDLKIFCNYQTPEFKPRFKLVCGTRNATFEGVRMNYIQAGQIFKEIVNASLGTPSSWDILIEDFQDLLQMLENPILEEAYLMRNHPALLALKLHSQFFMACYETLMRASLQSVFEVFKMLPYGMNDSSGHWKVRLEQHPYLWWMLHSQFTSYGDRNSEQCRYRRNYSCHKIHHLTKRTERFKWYSANDVDMLLYQYLPMSLPGLMRAMWHEGLLALFCLRLDELFTK